MSFIWTATAGNYTRSNIKSYGVPPVKFEATITGKGGVECASPIAQSLSKNAKDPVTRISFNTKASCTNPHVTTTIKDKDGNILDQKEFNFVTSADHGPKPLSSKSIIFIVAALVVVVIIGVSMRRKKSVTM
jgi:hypothetical protein